MSITKPYALQNIMRMIYFYNVVYVLKICYKSWLLGDSYSKATTITQMYIVMFKLCFATRATQMVLSHPNVDLVFSLILLIILEHNYNFYSRMICFEI